MLGVVSDEAFDAGVRLGRVQRGSDGVDTDAPSASAKVTPVDRVAIVEQMAWLLAPGRRLDDQVPGARSATESKMSSWADRSRVDRDRRGPPGEACAHRGKRRDD